MVKKTEMLTVHCDFCGKELGLEQINLSAKGKHCRLCLLREQLISWAEALKTRLCITPDHN